MDAKQREKSRFFDRVAREWATHGYSIDELRRVTRLIRRSKIQRGMRILEPGCGPGLITPLIAQCVGPGGYILALDISPAMVEQCEKRTSDFPQVRVEHGAIEDFTAHEGEFDCVFCFNSFPHFTDREKALHVAARCLRPGGSFVIAHSNSRKRINEIHMRVGDAVMHDALPKPRELQRLAEAHGLLVTETCDDDDSFLFSAEKR